MPNEKFILNEFKKAIDKYARLPVVDLDEKVPYKFDYTVTTFRDILKQTGKTIYPNRWSYYRIYIVTKGAGDFLSGIYKFRASENTLIVMPSRMITSSKNWTDDADGYVGLFNIDFFLQNSFPYKYISDKKILTPSIKPYISITEEQTKKISGIFEDIIKENAGNSEDKTVLIALKFLELLIISERLFSEKQDIDSNLSSIDIVKKFADCVETYFESEHSVKFYATQLHIHPNHLNTLIKKHTALTAKESIQSRLLLEAKYLLHSTALSVKEIANELGFTDPNYFTVFFKRSEKISPANYRASIV